MSAILSKKNRRGVTLVELLIVISILLGLLALAVPAMRPAMESKQIRDAARAVNVYFSTARSRAIETGRPCGVLLERDPNLPQACITLRQVEVPPPYSGDTTDTYVTVQLDGAVSGGWANVIIARASGSFAPDVLRIGDQVQFNYQGPWYQIMDAASYDSTTKYIHASPAVAPNGDGFPLKARTYIGAGGAVPWTSTASRPLPTTILRQPVTSSTPPLQLPGRAIVDLFYSGKEDTTVTTFGRGDLNTRIVFSPNGSVDWISYDSSNPQERATSSLYLLVGRRDRALLDASGTYVPQSQDGIDNLGDMNNLWVAISPQTGLITTSEVANASGAPAAQQLAKARQIAREKHRMGGD